LLTFLCKGRLKPKNVNNSLWTGFVMTMAAAFDEGIENFKKAIRKGVYA